MNYGLYAWAALMAALALVYFRGMRSDGLPAKRMALIALIWVAIISLRDSSGILRWSSCVM